MLALTAMSSFSDAHELPEIPIIAANLHRLMLPRQNQIWAVLHASDSDQRLTYSLAATFLGRMCLSGEIDRLSPAQWEMVRRAQSLYKQAAPIIKNGTSRRFDSLGESWRYPEGWQALVRVSTDEKNALVVLHTFANSPARIEVPLPMGSGWQITSEYSNSEDVMSLSGAGLVYSMKPDFSAGVVLLKGRPI